MRNVILRSSLFVLFALLATNVYSDVKPASIFCDHMVLQQKSKVPIWGWALPTEQITIQPNWQECVSVNADKNGNWKIDVNTPAAGGPYNIKIKGQNEIVISDVLIGEVWLCSGQSNMEVPLGWLATARSRNDIALANNDKIRIFDLKDRFSIFEENDCIGQWDTWRPAISDNIQWFSAVGYYFGKRLYEELNIPIGLISSHWGGTEAECWMDLDTIKNFKRLENTANILTGVRENNEDPDVAFAKMINDWLKEVEDEEQGVKDKWYDKDLNDSDWQQMNQPTSWGSTSLKDVHGSVWFRKEINLAKNPPRNLEINLGKIDDIDSVWINNNYVSTTIGYNINRTYKIPFGYLSKGRNIIAVRVIDTGGDGGFIGESKDMKICSASEELINLAGRWKYKVSNPKTNWQEPRFTKISQNFPTALFNAMIAPLVPFKIAGVIWYQGEGNVVLPIEYRTLFPAMIQNWRNRWGQGDFPFYYVQIAPWAYGDSYFSQALREAQMMTLSLPNTGMAVTMDIGEEKDIHPRNKHDVGDRLARWALNKTYGKLDVVFSGPLYKEMKIDGNSIRLFFDYANDGLLLKGSELADFTIAGGDKKFVPAKAVIDGNTIIVSSPLIEKPVAVRFAWSNFVQPNLFNMSLLPASSFRTDDWPL